jgi:hypothetical protein
MLGSPIPGGAVCAYINTCIQLVPADMALGFRENDSGNRNCVPKTTSD